jgi:hypothetical protein
MTRLADIADRLRAKNAGPFWLTIDIFCPDAASYERVVKGLDTATDAALYDVPTQVLKRFDIAALNVVKISMPRPTVQGSREDRDMHASQWAWLLSDMDIA